MAKTSTERAQTGKEPAAKGRRDVGTKKKPSAKRGTSDEQKKREEKEMLSTAKRFISKMTPAELALSRLLYTQPWLFDVVTSAGLGRLPPGSIHNVYVLLPQGDYEACGDSGRVQIDDTLAEFPQLAELLWQVPHPDDFVSEEHNVVLTGFTHGREYLVRALLPIPSTASVEDWNTFKSAFKAAYEDWRTLPDDHRAPVIPLASAALLRMAPNARPVGQQQEQEVPDAPITTTAQSAEKETTGRYGPKQDGKQSVLLLLKPDIAEAAQALALARNQSRQDLIEKLVTDEVKANPGQVAEGKKKMAQGTTRPYRSRLKELEEENQRLTKALHRKNHTPG